MWVKIIELLLKHERLHRVAAVVVIMLAGVPLLWAVGFVLIGLARS